MLPLWRPPLYLQQAGCASLLSISWMHQESTGHVKASALQDEQQ